MISVELDKKNGLVRVRGVVPKRRNKSRPLLFIDTKGVIDYVKSQDGLALERKNLISPTTELRNDRNDGLDVEWVFKYDFPKSKVKPKLAKRVKPPVKKPKVSRKADKVVDVTEECEAAVADFKSKKFKKPAKKVMIPELGPKKKEVLDIPSD